MLALKITGLGQYLPRNKVFSLDLDHQLGFPPHTVQQKSGLIASPEKFSSWPE